MNILIWNSLSISQGNIFFFNNVFSKTLIQQANSLSSLGHNVDIILTEHTQQFVNIINKKVNKIFFSNKDILKIKGSFASLEKDFYIEKNTDLIERITLNLSEKLKSNYDAILVWETPVPFLKKLYPNSIILNQMPGAFCKAPYPHMITIDLEGLYKQSTIYKYSHDINKYQNSSNLLKNFKNIANDAFLELSPFNKQITYFKDKFDKLSLLPLQVTEHYNFKTDTKYQSQTELLYDVLEKTKLNNGVIVTQYISKLLSDQCITKDLDTMLKNNYSNYCHEEIFDNVSNPSQYFVPKVDEIITCSSSLAFQGMLFNKNLKVFGKTFLEPYSSEKYSSKQDIDLSYDNTCAFILEKYSCLAQNICEGQYLTNYIEEAINKKNNTSTNKYPSMIDIQTNYENNLLDSFKIFDSKKELTKKKLIANISLNYFEKFQSIISNTKIKVISFDIFDTLISRNIARPSDLYKLLEKECYILTDGKITNFCELRCIAEVESRKINQNKETSLNLIYSFLRKNFLLDDQILLKLKKLEINLEKKFTTCQECGKKLFNIAKSTNKQIVYTSDMYLSNSIIKSLLEKNGYPIDLPLFLSTDEGASKKEGLLFDVLLKRLDISPSEIVHIGDNPNNDIIVPQNKGITTFRVISPLLSIKKNSSWKILVDNYMGISSCCLSLIANKYWSMPRNNYESMFNDKTGEIFGYSCLGPMVFGYVSWIINKCIENKVDKIIFLAREGKFCKIAYDILSKKIPNSPKSEYALASRRSLNVATIDNELDIISIASQPFVSGSNAKQIISSRFGLDRTLIPGKYNIVLEYNNDDRLKLIKMALSLSEHIYNESNKERNLYQKYLLSLNITNSQNIAIVDIGWKCRMQYNLSKILKRSLIGFYYSTINGYEYTKSTDNNSILIYDHCNASKLSRNYIDNNRHIVESLLCCEDSSFIKFEENNNIVNPVFDITNDNIERKITLTNFKKGITNFISDINCLLDSRYSNDIHTDFLDKLLEIACSSQNIEDLQLFSKLTFSDAIGGISTKNCISTPKKELCTVQNNEKNRNTNKTIKTILILKIETIFIRCFTKKKLYEKYTKSRKLFFIDSKNRFIHTYYDITNTFINSDN